MRILRQASQASIPSMTKPAPPHPKSAFSHPLHPPLLKFHLHLSFSCRTRLFLGTDSNVVPRKTQRLTSAMKIACQFLRLSDACLPGLDSPISLHLRLLPAAPRLSRRGRPGAGDLSRSLGERGASGRQSAGTPRTHSAQGH